MTAALAPTPLTPRRLAVALGLALMASMAIAGDIEAQNPEVRARIDLMKDLKAQSGVLIDMASGKAPFDAAKAEATIEALRNGADKVEPAFRARADDPASDALPDIWNAPSEFRQKANKLVKTTMDLQGGSPDDLIDGLQAVGAACKDCHGRFKM